MAASGRGRAGAGNPLAATAPGHLQ